jgi:hypothetical protein
MKATQPITFGKIIRETHERSITGGMIEKVTLYNRVPRDRFEALYRRSRRILKGYGKNKNEFYCYIYWGTKNIGSVLSPKNKKVISG